MAYRDDFVKGETLKANDLNANFTAIKTGTALDIGSVLTDAIKNGTIKLEDLAQEVVDAISGSLQKTEYFDILSVPFTTFDLSAIPGHAESERVFVNGMIQQENVFYTISGKTITIIDPNDLNIGDIITVTYSV